MPGSITCFVCKLAPVFAMLTEQRTVYVSIIKRMWACLFVQSVHNPHSKDVNTFVCSICALPLSPFVCTCHANSGMCSHVVCVFVFGSLFARSALLRFCSYLFSDSKQMLTIATSPWQIGLLVWPFLWNGDSCRFYTCVLWHSTVSVTQSGHSQPR